MEKIELYCDGSVNPQEKVGFGAYFIYNGNLQKQDIKMQRFENTSSSRLELQVLLWALEKENVLNYKVLVYTDCQNIINLPNRERKLEENSYCNSNGKLIKNHDLYKKFFEQNKRLTLEFIKVKGHKKSNLKNSVDILFNLVDKASRKALREEFK